MSSLFDFEGLTPEQLLFLHACKEEEPLSYEEFSGGSGDMDRDQSWYPSESVLAEWKRGKEKTCIPSEEPAQGHTPP